MERDKAIGILERLHSAQNKFYAGGSGAMLKQLLTADISWTVPGNNRIAGTYRGLEEVFGYLRRRRDLADQTFHMIRRDVLVGTGLQVAALTDGVATIGGTAPLVNCRPVRDSPETHRSMLAAAARPRRLRPH